MAAQSLTLCGPDGSGDLVLRQQGVSDPFTGYIEGGGTSPPIPLAGGASTNGWQTFYPMFRSVLTTSCQRGWITSFLSSACSF